MLIEALVCGMVILALRWFFKEQNPLDELPGPFRLPIIGNTFPFTMNAEDVLYDLIKLTKTYGYRYMLKIFNVRDLRLIDPVDIEVVLSHSRNIKKSLPYRFLQDWLGDGLLVSTGSHWHKRRKILTPAFHFNILKNFAVIIEENTRDLVQLLKEKNGDDVDLMPLISDYTLFTICETAMGTKLDKDRSASAEKYKNAISTIGLHIFNRLIKIWMWSNLIFKISSQGRKLFKSLEIAHSFTENIIRKAKHKARAKEETTNEEFGTKKRLAMLNLLLEAEAKSEIDIKGVRDEVNTFMFEGHDTTAVAITYGLMLLADHEEVQERVFKEVKDVLGDSDRTLSMPDLIHMKYLDAVIKEVLRLYPSVPLIGRETVEDIMLGDLLVKKGTTIDIHIYELHHREDLYPDAEAFKPERFLDSDIKHPYAYIPFSAGPRNCIGQRFALQELKCAFSEIVRNFKLVPKLKGARPKLKADLVIRPVDPIYIKFISR